jgi:hypothetical protein
MADQSQPIRRIELLAPQERRQILFEWNATARTYIVLINDAGQYPWRNFIKIAVRWASVHKPDTLARWCAEGELLELLGRADQRLKLRG